MELTLCLSSIGDFRPLALQKMETGLLTVAPSLIGVAGQDSSFRCIAYLIKATQTLLACVCPSAIAGAMLLHGLAAQIMAFRKQTSLHGIILPSKSLPSPCNQTLHSNLLVTNNPEALNFD